MLTLQPDKTLADIAREYPQTLPVMIGMGLDVACAGGRTLEESCRRQSLEVRPVLEALERAAAQPGPINGRWDRQPLDTLLDHLMDHYHRVLSGDLSRLETMAAQIAGLHPEPPARVLGEIRNVFQQLAVELRAHLQKEETVLFPWIRSGRGRSAAAPIQVMTLEHQHTSDLLSALRSLSGNYAAPPEADSAWRSLYQELSLFESRLREHMHLENNVLFPRALHGW